MPAAAGHRAPSLAESVTTNCDPSHVWPGRGNCCRRQLEFFGPRSRAPDSIVGVHAGWREAGSPRRAPPHPPSSPGIALMLTVFALNLVGDALQDRLGIQTAKRW